MVSNICPESTLTRAVQDASPAPAPDHDPTTAFLRAQIDHENRVTEAERNEPALRLQTVKLVSSLANTLNEHAVALAAARGEDSPFACDDAANDLLWALSEYLVQATINRHEPGEDSLCLAHQLTPTHAGYWFNVGFNALNDEPVALGIEGVRNDFQGPFHRQRINRSPAPDSGTRLS